MTFPNLQNQEFMSLTSFRKNGQAVPTPVWFAQVGDNLYVYTSGTAGKVKRIRNNGQVTVAPCTASGQVLGESASGQARIIEPNMPEGNTAESALNKKYGWQKRALMVMNAILRIVARRQSNIVYLEIRP